MSMSTSVCGLLENDARHKKIIAVVQACFNAGIERCPNEVDTYFEGSKFHGCRPGWILEGCSEGLDVELPKEAVKESEGGAGFIVDLTKIPKQIKKIKFENSW